MSVLNTIRVGRRLHVHSSASKHLSRPKRNYSTPSPLPLAYSEYSEPSKTVERHPPVLMTHGLLGSKQNWNTIAKAVSRLTTRKVITFDARNHGDSPHSDLMTYEAMCDDVIGLADQLGLQKFILLGHSMGGRMAMILALKYPKRMSKLIVVDISPLSLGGDFNLMQGYLEALNSMNFEPGMTLSDARRLADTKLRTAVTDPAVRAFLITNLARRSEGGQIYWKPNVPVLLQNLERIKEFPEELLAAQSISPTLLTRGERSVYVPKEHFDGIRGIFPNIEFATVKNAGHWPQADNPTAFIETLVQFLYKKKD